MNKLSIIHLINGYFLLFILAIPPCKAQDDLKPDDKREISYQAKMLIKEYEILLNVLSMKGTTLSESQIIIGNSYTPTSTQIFTDSLVVVEDDLDPLHTTQKQQNPPKSSIRDYLNALYLLYQKSDQPSIVFNGIMSSEVKKRDYTYIQVFFDSKFNNAHKEVSIPYSPTKRIAEVRADFVNNNWQTKIVSVTYWDESQPFKDTVYTTDASALLASITSENPVQQAVYQEDSAAVIATSQEDLLRYEQLMMARMDSIAKEYYEERARKIEQREERERKEMEAQFNNKMESYQLALDNGDYERALMALEEALPFATPSQKASVENEKLKVERIIADQARIQRERLQDAKSKARRFGAMKYYDEAVTWYQQALELDPNQYQLRDSISEMNKMKATLEPYLTQINQRRYDDVTKELNQVIRDNRNFADLYFLRGMAYDFEGRTKKAFDDYDDAIALSSNFRDAYIYRGNLHLKEQKIADAIADFGMALAIYDQDTALLIRRANLNLHSRQESKAIEDLSRAISIYPGKTAWYMQRGKLYRNAQQYDQALNDFAQATSLSSEDPQTWYFKGLAYVDLGDIYGAAAEFEKARNLELDQTSLQTIQSIANNLYHKGLQATQQQAYLDAVEHFNGAIAIVPAYKEAWFAMGEARMSINDALSAISNFTEAINLDNQYYQAFYQRGLARVANDQLSLATQDFDEAGKISPSFIQTHLKSGETYARLNDPDKAIQAYRRALSVNPEQALIHYSIGKLYMQISNYQSAITSFNQALDINNEYADAYFQRGLTYTMINNHKNAHDDFSDAIKYESNFAQAYYERGKLYRYVEENNSKAIDDFTAAINAQNNYVDALLERGKAYYAAEEYNNSLRDLKQAVALNDNLLDNPQVRIQLGYNNLHANQTQVARDHFDQAGTIASGREADITLGLAYCDLWEKKFETGFELMEQAFQQGDFNKKVIKKSDLSAPVKKDKRFKRLLKQYL